MSLNIGFQDLGGPRMSELLNPITINAPALGGGSTGLMGNLFKNPLFLQLLSAGGASLASGKIDPLAGAVQQNISSQNYWKVLKKMFAGDIPEGGKIVQTDTGMQIHLPKIEGGATPTTSSSGGDEGANDLLGTLKGMLSGGPVGFQPSQSISASDLAGVTPEMLSQMFGMKVNTAMAQEEMRNRKMADIADIFYKNRNLDIMENYYQGLLKNSADQNEIDQYRNYIAAWKEMNADDRTNFQKEYDFAVSQGYKGEPWEWKTLADDPETIKLYKAAVDEGSFDPKKDGGLWGFIKKRAQAGATVISPYDRATQTNQASREADILSPDFASNVQQDLMKADPAFDEPGPAEYTPIMKQYNVTRAEAQAAIVREKVRKAMGTRIRQVYGDAVQWKLGDGWYLNGKRIVKDPYAK